MISAISLRRRRSSSGNVLVETSLIFIVFAAILIGAFDFAQFLFVHQALVERARAATRWGAIRDPTDSASITNMVLFNQPTAPEPGTPSYFNLRRENITVTNPDPGTDQHRLNVRISGYAYTVLSPYIAGSYTGPPVLVSVPLGLYD